jgi:MerR family transcriptional regulator, light-induced transcriptional regulator
VTDEGFLRIGELSRRSGVRPELLRAWERRYGLLDPMRSPGGLRLYSVADLERVRLMRQLLADGLAAAEAAAVASRPPLDEPRAAPAPAPDAARVELGQALERFDEPSAQAIIDRVLAVATVDTLLTEVVMPYLSELGKRWERGDASIAQEHFASSVLRGRLLGLGRGWGLGLGPAAVLACLPGEQHDLGLIAFGLALRARGWRIAFLGSDTPVETVHEASRDIKPSLVVLSAVTSERAHPYQHELEALAGEHQLALGGPAARDGIDLMALPGDPVSEAERVTVVIRTGERHENGSRTS